MKIFTNCKITSTDESAHMERSDEWKFDITLAQDMPTVGTSTDQVLSTVELLEKIICGLPTCKIYTVLRTCKHWHIVITESTRIQQRMFQVPQGKVVAPEDIKEINFMTVARYSEELELNVGLVGTRYWASAAANIVCYYVGFDSKHEKNNQVWQPASFQSMFLSQPPCTTAMLCLIHPGPVGGKPNAKCTLKDPNGLTLGFVEDVLKKMRADHPAKDDDSAYLGVIIIFTPVSEGSKKSWVEDVERRRDQKCERAGKEAGAEDWYHWVWPGCLRGR